MGGSSSSFSSDAIFRNFISVDSFGDYTMHQKKKKKEEDIVVEVIVIGLDN